MREKSLYTVVVADDEDELRQAVCSMVQRFVDLHGAYRQAMEAASYAEPRESSVHFVSDLRPATIIFAAKRSAPSTGDIRTRRSPSPL